MRFDVDGLKTDSNNYNFGNTNQTHGHRFIVDKDITLNAVYMFRSQASRSSNVSVRVYDYGSKGLLASSLSPVLLEEQHKNTWIRFILNTPVALKKGQEYLVAYYFDNFNVLGSLYTTFPQTLSTPDNNVNFSFIEGMYINAGDTFPTTINRVYRISMGFDFFYYIDVNRTLIFHEGVYKYFDVSWKSLGSTVTENDYITYGIEDISTIPESAWSELQGDIEICYWTDSVKSNVTFDVECFEPFILSDTWEGQTIKVLEYNDSPFKVDSIVSIDIEPISVYDELGDNVDVLYYTDDPTVTDPKLHITANYSPLDELEGDFDVVTWSDSGTVPHIESSIIPSPQVVVQTEPYTIYGDLLAVVSKLTSENGKLRFAVSFNGREWKSWRYGEWRTIDIHDLPAFKQDGMSHYDLNRMKSSELAKYDSIQLAYYIEDNIHNSDQGTSLDAMQLKVDAATDTARLEGLVFNVVNTKATIQLSLSGNKLSGKLEDSDMGKIQYRILLNGVPYFPSDGQFTPLAPSPLHIDFNVSERDIKFNQLNTLRVEFQDFWGETDHWETTFTGAYSGLMFMDESGEYLSDTFGGILKYLDFDVIFAGQTTIDQKVVIKNQLGYPVDELLLKVNESKLPEGVQIELSRQQSPFLPTNYITYGYTDMDQTQEFYVRIVTDLNAKTIPDGIFELKLNAKRTT